MVTVIGVATVIHIALKYQEKRRGKFWEGFGGGAGGINRSDLLDDVDHFLGIFCVDLEQYPASADVRDHHDAGTLSVYPAIAFLVPFGVLSGGNSMNSRGSPSRGLAGPSDGITLPANPELSQKIWTVSLILTGFTGWGLLF